MTSFGDEDLTYWVKQSYKGYIIEVRAPKIRMTRERIASLPPDDFRPRTASFKEPLLSRNLGLVDVLRSIGERHGCTPGEIAIAWTLREPVVTGAIVGMRSAEQAKQIVRSAEFRLSADEVLEIEAYLTANPLGK